MKITDKRKHEGKKALTFGDLAVGEWFEYLEGQSIDPKYSAPGPRRKTSDVGLHTIFPQPTGGFSGSVEREKLVRRLDVELIIHGEID